jgi:hypothetical protein
MFFEMANRSKNNILCSLTAAGWILFTFGVIQFPFWALIVIIKKRKGTFLEVSYYMHR